MDGWSAPLQLTRFFGRRVEISELERLLGQVRLVTLVGGPGCGKTRLALEVAARLIKGYRAGVRWVGLASISDPTLVANVVAAALGVSEQPGRTIEETLVEALADTELLIVLDNCEHVAAAAASIAGHLLATCPRLQVLGTSRAPLGLPGEQRWPVPVLEIGDAVELFLDRAHLVSPRLGADPAAEAPTEEICRHLDCLPLAIELTAAWSRVLSLSQIIDRLESPLLLASRAPLGDGRHASMASAVEWSYTLLSSAQRDLFDRMAVFAGGFDLRAVPAVATETADPLDEVKALVDHSLVVVESQPASPARYKMLEPIRQFAESRLAISGQTDETRRRHAEHYLQVALESDVDLRGVDWLAALGRLEREEPNLLAAIRWAGSQQSDVGLRLCAALSQFWVIAGRVNEGWALMSEMLEVDTSDLRLKSTALSRAGKLAWLQQDHDRASALIEESLEIRRELDDPLGVARRLRDLAPIAIAQGDTHVAVEICEQSMSIFRKHDDDRGLGSAMLFLGWALYLGGDPSGAEPWMQEALLLNRRTGHEAATSLNLLGLALTAWSRGDVATVRTLLTDHIQAARSGGYALWDPAWLWSGFALAVAEGRTHSALRLAGGAEALAKHAGMNLYPQLLTQMQPIVDRLHDEVGHRTADRLIAKGSRLTLEEMMAEALAEPASPERTLSRREWQVAELLTQGLANDQIAQRLFISKRTVESHIDHIKGKLRVTSRRQVIAWLLSEGFGGYNP